ncbi:MAG TPA: hypothetical protein VFB32_06275 [Rudaea sp.]|nr:hypothetical protein [Rudaea sp.]
MARYFVSTWLLVGIGWSAASVAQVIGAPPADLRVFANSAGEVIAFVAGTIPACGTTPDGSDPTYTIHGNVIDVTQGTVEVTCTNPPPPDRYYYATVNLGRLFDGDYTINWNVPALSKAYGASGHASLGPEFSGNWFDANESGHGFALEVLPGNPPQLLAYWLVFAPGGGEAWVSGVGPITGNSAVLQAYQVAGAGAKFPPHFVPSQVHAQAWGTLTFTFTDCNSGRVDWNSTAPGYGSGSLPLVRLTMPAGINCSTAVVPAPGP